MHQAPLDKDYLEWDLVFLVGGVFEVTPSILRLVCSGAGAFLDALE